MTGYNLINSTVTNEGTSVYSVLQTIEHDLQINIANLLYNIQI